MNIMLLKELELAGFKSFAKKTKLSFASPLAAIVGPNGSGKSNVAEAFAFVLGEQSRDAMRAKRGEDLIWNGSKTVARLGRASVSLVFDNREKTFDIDFDEVILSREVHRDGASEYSINGAKSRLRDVLELLASAHIGTSRHHIISQGETDRVLAASPKERREMIEDALGLRIFEFKIGESERKLLKTRENMREVGLLRKELAPRMQFLKKQMERIERAKALREDLAKKYREYFRREEAYISRERSALRDEKEAPRRELAEIEREVREMRNTLEFHEKNGEEEELFRIESRQKEVRDKKDALSRKLGRTEGMIEARKGAENAMIPSGRIREFGRIVQGLLDEALGKGEMSGVKETLSRLKEKIRDFVEGIEGKYGGKASAEDLEAEREALAQDIDALGNEEGEIIAKYERMKKEADERRGSMRDTEKKLFDSLEKERHLALALDSLKRRETDLEREEREMKQELAEAGILAGRDAVRYENEHLPDSAEHEEREEQLKRRKDIERMKIRLEETGVGGGDDMVKEFEEVSERDQFLERELKDLEESAESLEKIINDLHAELENQFEDGLRKINEKFREYFTLLFGGGTAELALIAPKKKNSARSGGGDELAEISEEERIGLGIVPDEQETGIDISLSLPHKRLRGIQMLSGGERTLASIALLFAVSQVNPPPFLVLDETDAALDEANSKKYGDMLAELGKTTQLIIITHNRETMSRAGIIYGITSSGDAASKVLSIQFEEAEGMMAR